MCGTGYKNTVLKERTEQGEGFGHVSDIVGDVSEDTAVFDVELVDNSHDFGCHHFVIYLVQVDLIAEVGDYFVEALSATMGVITRLSTERSVTLSEDSSTVRMIPSA